MKKTVDIYIRTYHKDLAWLQFCLKSIHKYVTGYRHLIVCIPPDEKHLLKDFNLPTIIDGTPGKNGYILQQVDKLLSYKHTDAEFILFVDSDVCFKEPVNVKEYFKKGKPIIFETPWELVGDAQCWKECTEKILKIETDSEKMRRLPILYRRDTLEALDKMHNCSMLARLDRLSEFNLAGSFAKHYEPKNYYFWHTENEPDLPKQKHVQNWSWGGLTDVIRNELEEITK